MNAPLSRMVALPFSCGGCGDRFASKSAKRRHKRHCEATAPECEQRYIPSRAERERIQRAASDDWNAIESEVDVAEYARRTLAAMSPERRAELEAL